MEENFRRIFNNANLQPDEIQRTYIYIKSMHPNNVLFPNFA